MLLYLTLILVCQLAGEALVLWSGVPVPGPVVGMVILFCGLVLRGGLEPGLANVADALLGNLSLLFVPAGVGIMLHASLIGADWQPITAALIASTLLTIAVTATAMLLLTRRAGGASDDGAKEKSREGARTGTQTGGRKRPKARRPRA